MTTIQLVNSILKIKDRKKIIRLLNKSRVAKSKSPFC